VGSHFEEQARQNFRQALARLRKRSGRMSCRQRQFVQLADGRIASDLGRMESLIRDGGEAALRQALGYANGIFLEGIDVREEAYEEWLRGERHRIAGLIGDACVRLGALEFASGDAASAMAHGQAALRQDALREDAHRLVMRGLAKSGRRSEALKYFQSLSERLKKELNTAPEAETLHCQEAIRAGNDNGNIWPGETAAPPLPEKPSIAVLLHQPVGRSEQEYFADGMVERSSRSCRGCIGCRNRTHRASPTRSRHRQQAGRELGVRYLLEGSVRKAGNRVRITGQLIDASTGATLWADRFEGEMQDVFDLQDQVTARVVGAIAPRLEQAEIERSKRKPTESLDAYDYYLRGLACVHQWTREANEEALSHLYRAIELDPNFASPHGMAARCYTLRKAFGWVTDRDFDMAEARRLARRVTELGRDDALSLCTAGYALAYVAGEWADGGAMVERALALNPNLAWAWLFSSLYKVWNGQPEIAIEHAAQAMRLSPQDAHMFSMQSATANAHFVAGRYDEALRWAEMAIQSQPNARTPIVMVAAAAALVGDSNKARRAMLHLMQIEPGLRVANLGYKFPFQQADIFARLADALSKAGLPE
jgi:TolB-like protein/Tfp pilus assembly protein PilF